MAVLKSSHIALIGFVVIAAGLTLFSFKKRLLDKLASFIPSVELFDPHPYWDVSRYSWGYGTAAPGSTGTITRDQAFVDMTAHLLSDYNYLSPLITRKLSVSQWAAYLSFSYNLGPGNADNLVNLINSGDDQALGEKWNEYVYAGGKVSSNLVERRQKEWDLWNS